eukprot:GHVT01045791.1.p1 GENE.GHVT01045791.1~~GHVT01045791.1.p1  ORF type:complete len:882 (+),score=113.86 GHVT01045791.1:288-2933(+)
MSAVFDMFFPRHSSFVSSDHVASFSDAYGDVGPSSSDHPGVSRPNFMIIDHEGPDGLQANQDLINTFVMGAARHNSITTPRAFWDSVHRMSISTGVHQLHSPFLDFAIPSFSIHATSSDHVVLPNYAGDAATGWEAAKARNILNALALARTEIYMSKDWNSNSVLPVEAGHIPIQGHIALSTSSSSKAAIDDYLDSDSTLQQDEIDALATVAKMNTSPAGQVAGAAPLAEKGVSGPSAQSPDAWWTLRRLWLSAFGTTAAARERWEEGTTVSSGLQMMGHHPHHGRPSIAPQLGNVQILRSLEALVRSQSASSQTLHHSFNFYFFTAPNRHASSGTFLYPVVAIFLTPALWLLPSGLMNDLRALLHGMSWLLGVLITGLPAYLLATDSSVGMGLLGVPLTPKCHEFDPANFNAYQTFAKLWLQLAVLCYAALTLVLLVVTHMRKKPPETNMYTGTNPTGLKTQVDATKQPSDLVEILNNSGNNGSAPQDDGSKSHHRAKSSCDATNTMDENEAGGSRDMKELNVVALSENVHDRTAYRVTEGEIAAGSPMHSQQVAEQSSSTTKISTVRQQMQRLAQQQIPGVVSPSCPVHAPGMARLGSGSPRALSSANSFNSSSSAAAGLPLRPLPSCDSFSSSSVSWSDSSFSPPLWLCLRALLRLMVSIMLAILLVYNWALSLPMALVMTPALFALRPLTVRPRHCALLAMLYVAVSLFVVLPFASLDPLRHEAASKIVSVCRAAREHQPVSFPSNLTGGRVPTILSFLADGKWRSTPADLAPLYPSTHLAMPSPQLAQFNHASSTYRTPLLLNMLYTKWLGDGETEAAFSTMLANVANEENKVLLNIYALARDAHCAGAASFSILWFVYLPFLYIYIIILFILPTD